LAVKHESSREARNALLGVTLIMFDCLLISFGLNLLIICKGKKKVKISLLQALEAHRIARGQGSHIT
jgi:hypothetical protein